ncbi:hypothetical protein Q7P35_006607 [Cladosporium inversicolor]
MSGAHTGVSIAKQLKAILDHFRISEKFGYAIADDASENTACLNHLSELLNIDLDKRRVMCIGHVINLVAQECLFGSDVEAFEEEIQNATAEEYDAAARAVKLRVAIEEFVDHELGDYYAAMARYSKGRSQGRKAPKAPKLLNDVLDADDWSVISHTSAIGDRAVKGAIWQETIESQQSQRLQPACTQSSAPSPPPTTTSPEPVRTTRSSQSIPISRISAPTDSSESPNATTAAEEQMLEPDEAEVFDFNFAR